MANTIKYKTKEEKDAAQSLKSRNFRLKSKYGISPDEFDAMVYGQGGRCAICGKIPDGERGLNVDHDHEKGTIRELLCGNCNKALGLVFEDVDILWRMIIYVRRWKPLTRKQKTVV